MITLKEIAKIAGVSVSTVSKALNGAHDIGEATRKRIIKAAEENGYNFSKDRAAGMTVEYRPAIAFVYPDMTSAYFSQIFNSFDEKLRAKNGTLILGCSRFEPELEKRILEYFIESGMVDGIVCITPFDQIDRLVKPGIPMVAISQTDSVINTVDTIKVDDRQGIFQVISRFKELGHRRIAYIGEKYTYSRLKYFREAMEMCGCEIDESLVIVSSNRFEYAGYDLMIKLIEKNNLPTAIFASYDDIATGVTRALYEHNLRIPEDISIVGLDNTASSYFFKERLSTIECHIDEQAQIALSILLNKIYNKQFTAVQNILIKTELIERDTISVPRTQ